MDNMKSYILSAVILLCYTLGYSQDSNSELNSYLEMAAMNNPEVKAAFNQYLAAAEKAAQVGSMPDPQATFGYFIKPMELLGGSQRADIQLMQMFPWFGTLKAARDEASMMAKARYAAFNAVKAELFFAVKSQWYQLMKLDREIILVKENIELLESLENLALMKFQSSPDDGSSSDMSGNSSMNNTSEGSMKNSNGGMKGMKPGTADTKTTGTGSSSTMSGGMKPNQAGLQDVLRVKMEILGQQNRLATLIDQNKTEEARFNALLNRDPDAHVQIPDSLIAEQLPINRFAIADSILRSNPMLAMLESENESYTLMEQKARMMGLPMMGIGLDYMLIQKREGNQSMMNGKDMFMPMVSVSVPIYRKKFNAMQNEARFMREAGDQQFIDLKNNLLVQYRQFIQNLDDAERRITLYREQEDLARITAELLLSEFTTSGNDYEEVLRMELKILEYGFNHIEAIVDYNTSVATAEKLMNSVNY